MVAKDGECPSRGLEACANDELCFVCKPLEGFLLWWKVALEELVEYGRVLAVLGCFSSDDFADFDSEVLDLGQKLFK